MILIFLFMIIKKLIQFLIIIKEIIRLSNFKNFSMQRQENTTEDNKCKYTVIPIQNEDHREKLDKFIKARGKIKLKGSLCRFYLRGICIMKPQYCKFAHSVKQLDLQQIQDLFYLSDKERKKRQFSDKRQFNQTALFILKNVKYHVLYNFQFSDRYKKSKLEVHDLQTISQDRGIRIRIRQIMHRQNWDGFLDFLQKRFPHTNYPISFISFWYANFGFDKPQTRCKFGDFLKYAMHVRKYIQVDIIFPPNTIPSIYLVNSQSKQTILQQNIEQIYKICMQSKQQQTKDKMQQFLQKALPQQLSKKYICRYYMAGNCQLPSQQCLYAHSIDELSLGYEIGQVFPIQYRQPVIPIQVRMNFTSLYQATRKFKQYQQYSLQDINLNSTIRNQLRQRIHHQLFNDFLNYLQNKLHKSFNKQQFFTLELKDLQKYYNGAGFNHTNQNKFQHLQGALWNLGYYMQDAVVKDEQTLQKRKVTYVYKIPPLQYLNSAFKDVIKQCVANQLKGLSQEGFILQSALRRVIYSYQRKQLMPLHVYLRYRNISFQDAVTQFCTNEQCQRIFFQSSQENVKKLIQLVKKYVKKNKKYILKVQQIQNYLKSEKKDQINLNHHFFNIRTAIQTSILDMGKKIYYWPFENNAYIIDNQSFNTFKNAQIQPKNKKNDKDETLSAFESRCTEQQLKKYKNQRIIVVDNLQKLIYSDKYLSQCAAFGVDLQGRLRIDGYVDLVQVSGVKRNKQNVIQHKQIFIFDIWKMSNPKKNQQQNLQNQETQISNNQQIIMQKGEISNEQNLLIKCIQTIKKIFQNGNKVKILHDCRHDSIALKHLLGINLQNVFDTSGFDVYLSQKRIYEMEKQLSSSSLLRKVYDVKVPGLNTILDSYKAPNGVNIFKQSMKKRFGDPQNRKYFEMRPIDQQFLQYSARDVQDLIQVYENMRKQDSQLLSAFIGTLYSKC